MPAHRTERNYEIFKIMVKPTQWGIFNKARKPDRKTKKKNKALKFSEHNWGNPRVSIHGISRVPIALWEIADTHNPSTIPNLDLGTRGISINQSNSRIPWCIRSPWHHPLTCNCPVWSRRRNQIHHAHLKSGAAVKSSNLRLPFGLRQNKNLNNQLASQITELTSKQLIRGGGKYSVGDSF